MFPIDFQLDDEGHQWGVQSNLHKLLDWGLIISEALMDLRSVYQVSAPYKVILQLFYPLTQ